MNEEQIKQSIELLRARRQSLGELRDYKPQKGKKSTAVAKPEREVEDTFGSLLTAEE